MIKDRYAGENKADETLELAEGIEKELHSIGLGAAVKMVCGELAIDRCVELLDGAAEAQELIEREGEPALCSCGKHYVGAPCPLGRKADHSGGCSYAHSYCKTCDMEVCGKDEADFHRHQGCDVTELPTDMNVNSNPDRSSPVYQDRMPEADAYIHQSSRKRTANDWGGKWGKRKDRLFSLYDYLYGLDSTITDPDEIVAISDRVQDELWSIIDGLNNCDELAEFWEDEIADIQNAAMNTGEGDEHYLPRFNKLNPKKFLPLVEDARKFLEEQYGLSFSKPIPVFNSTHQSRRINLASLKYGDAIARRVKKGDLPHYAYDVLEPVWRLDTDENGDQVLVRG